jgi:ATP-dependent exoDNAse (exonuclease V) alpha subunit
MYQLTSNQQEAFDYITANLIKERVILLEGSAVTGKTTLTKSICNYYNENKNVSVCAITPTHKSKKIIKNVLNENTIIPISALTVASALGKIKEHSYVGTKKYSNGSNKKLSSYGLFIVDEVSMIRDEDLKLIIAYVMEAKKQMLIIGDSNQIPCPNAKFIITTIIEKADSYIFNDDTITQLCLSEIVRQAEDSPIIKLSSFVKDNLLEDFPFTTLISATNFTNVIKYSDAYEVFKTHYTPNAVNSCRIIAYTNSAVRTHNLEIRNYLEYEEEFVVGELMTGYTNLGWPDLIIENGEDYFITKAEHTTTHKISNFTMLNGKLIQMKVADSNTVIKNLFFVNINHPNNNALISKIIELGEKINNRDSTKLDFRKYMELKNIVIFTEDIYKYEDTIYTENAFKESHPLLFVNVNEIIENYQLKDNALSKKIKTNYQNVIENRIQDKYKQLGDSETFADKYKVIEKDIYYGYSITAHKSQGSTYMSVIVDEPEFQKISNKWNYKYNKMESRIKEKNQLRYVAYTRAKHNLFIIYDK